MKHILLFFVLLALGCSNTHTSDCVDGSCDTIDAGPDTDVDSIPDVKDVVDPDIDADVDGDVEDYEWITVEDPHEIEVICEGDGQEIGYQNTVYYPYFFHQVISGTEDGDLYYMNTDLYRLNMETRENEYLGTIPFIPGRENGAMEISGAPTNYFIGCKRTLRMIGTNPLDWTVEEEECKTLVSQDVATGNYSIMDVDVDLRSEDCIATGTGVVNMRQYDAEAGVALLACNLGNGMGTDFYRFDFNSNEFFYLFRKSEDGDDHLVPSGHTKGNFHSSTAPYFVMAIGSNTFGINHREMVWNWKTGELLWLLDTTAKINTTLAISSTGIDYYNVTAIDDYGSHIQFHRVNVETLEDEVLDIGFRHVLYPIVALRDYPHYVTFQGSNVRDLYWGYAEPIPNGPSFMYLWDTDLDIRRKVSPNSVSKGISFLLPGTEYPRYLYYSRNTGCSYLKDLLAAGILDETGNLIYDPTEE